MWRNWNIFHEIDDLHREIDRLFGSSWPERQGRMRSSFLPGMSARSYPMLNVYEDKDVFVVEALAPGLDMDSLQVSVSGNTLTISGEKKPLPDVKTEAYHRNERATGKFVRTLQLNTEVKEDKGKAAYENGILTITLPKAERAKPRQIKVTF
jgi:HSP20 family protein